MTDFTDSHPSEGQDNIGPGTVLQDIWEIISPIGKGYCLMHSFEI
jgi:hypothetical protein